MSKTAETSRAKDTPVERDWIAAAREMLIEGGIASVQVSPLAARLGVTRGGFYWRFENRQDLLDHLLEDWEKSNAKHFLEQLAKPGAPSRRLQRLVNLWMEEKNFDPRLEAAIRHWATIDGHVRERVHAVDRCRIAAIADIFIQDGRDQIEAEVRARILYFHQVGYYALDLGETIELREKLMPHYTRIMAGFKDQ